MSLVGFYIVIDSGAFRDLFIFFGIPSILGIGKVELEHFLILRRISPAAGLFSRVATNLSVVHPLFIFNFAL